MRTRNRVQAKPLSNGISVWSRSKRASFLFRHSPLGDPGARLRCEWEGLEAFSLSGPIVHIVLDLVAVRDQLFH